MCISERETSYSARSGRRTDGRTDNRYPIKFGWDLNIYIIYINTIIYIIGEAETEMTPNDPNYHRIWVRGYGKHYWCGYVFAAKKGHARKIDWRGCRTPENTRRSANGVWMLDHCRRRWTSIQTALGSRLAFAGSLPVESLVRIRVRYVEDFTCGRHMTGHAFVHGESEWGKTR